MRVNAIKSKLTQQLSQLVLFVVTFLLSVVVVFASAETPPSKSAEQAVMQVLDRYLVAVNRIDLEAVTETYHFPHLRLVNNKLFIWQNAIDAMPMLNLSQQQQERAMRKALGPDWRYTDWEYRKLISISDTKAHVDTALIRYNSQDDIISRFESLYILTNENGLWAIKGRSSFAPQ